MGDSQQEIEALLGRIREGSQEAVKELLDRYGDTLLRVIRRRLSRPLRRQFDSDDFVQAVWASFFAAPPDLRRFESPEALIAFLTQVAKNKMADAARREFQAGKRDVNRTYSLDGSAAGPAARAPSRQPTPSQVVGAEDQWARMLEGQPEHARRILLLLRLGHTNGEVAVRLGVNEKTVRRVVERAFRTLAARDLP